MSVNLMEMVKGAVTNEIMGKLGGLLGQSDSQKTQSMFETAAGSILGGMMKKASSPQGADDIFKAVQGQDDGVLDRLGDLLGGGREKELMDSGGGILDGIFGSDRSGMLGQIAKVLGIDDSIVGKLLSMAAPIIMAVVGRHVKEKALDAVGLGSLLGEQKSALGGLLPSSLTSSLGFGNMLGGATDAVRDASSAVAGSARDAGSAVAGAASHMGKSVAHGADEAASGIGSLLKVLLPLILLAALGFLAYTYFFPSGVSSTPPAGVAGKSMEEGGSGAKFELTSLQDKFSGITSAFENGVTMDNAGALAQKITELTGSIGNMGIGDLEGAAKDSAFGAIGTFKAAVTKAMEGVQEQGILDILKPVIEKLMEVLGAFK